MDLVGGNGPHMEEMQTREAGAGAAGVRLWCWPGPGHVTEAAKRRLESGLVSERRAAGGLACPCSTRESWRAPTGAPSCRWQTPSQGPTQSVLPGPPSCLWELSPWRWGTGGRGVKALMPH